MLRRLLLVIGRIICHHSYLPKWGEGRMWMECEKCGHLTPGVTIHVTTR
jgi:hypothetical protein